MSAEYESPGCEIGQVMAKVFRELRWTKAEFSRQTGVEAAQVGKYYTGAQTPTPARLEEWAKHTALGQYAEAFSKALDADEAARLRLKKTTGRKSRRPTPALNELEQDARDAVLYVIAVLSKFPWHAKAIARRAKELEQIEGGAASAGQP